MATYKTEAIIVGRHDFGEADRVLVMVVPERGVVRAVAKGVRRIRSKMAGHLELFSRSELMLVEGKKLDVVTSARLINRPDITGSYEQMRLAYLMAEMVNRLGSDGEHAGLFTIFSETLNEAFSADAVTELWFKIRLLEDLGYSPQLAKCTQCHNGSGDESYFFSNHLGGIVCSRCRSAEDGPIDISQIKLWRWVLNNSIESTKRLDGAEEAASKSLAVCNGFYDYIFDKRFRSAELPT